jgi:hypothetical protein
LSGKERMTVCTEVLVKEFDDWRSESSRRMEVPKRGDSKRKNYQTKLKVVG